MLAAAAVLVALAASGLGSGSANGGGSTKVTQGAPAADQQAQPGLTRRGRHCRHGSQNRQAPQQDPQAGRPPV
jgi:hypothetical protein